MNRREFLAGFLADVEAISTQNDIPWLAALRIYRGVTQKDLAASMGLYLEEYQAIECSQTPDMKQVESVVEALGIPFDSISDRAKDLLAA